MNEHTIGPRVPRSPGAPVGPVMTSPGCPSNRLANDIASAKRHRKKHPAIQTLMSVWIALRT